MIYRRVSQFFHAISAQVTREDRAFLEQWLPEEPARTLFAAMTTADQCHALRTARTAEKLCSVSSKKAVDQRLLIRAALLHDVGRQKGDMGTMGKVLTVLLAAGFPHWSEKQSETSADDWLTTLLHVHYHHPRIGAEKLRRIGLSAEADLIAQHHAPEAEDDPPELVFLRQADQQN